MHDESQTKLPCLDHQVRQPKLSSDFFQSVDLIGEGTYGKVYRCKLESKLLADFSVEGDWTSSYRAMKSIKFESDKDGFPITALREI